MTGIYKIESPSGKVYVGQSVNIKKRINAHKNGYKQRSGKCPKLQSSIKKYGFPAHKISVLHELPADVGHKELDEYEILYIQCFRDCGVELMNLTPGGGAEALKSVNKGRRHSEETKKKIGDANRGQVRSEEIREANRSRRVGTKLTDAHKLKLHSGNIGRKHTEESKRKMSETVKASLAKKFSEGWVRGARSEETKRKIGETNKRIMLAKRGRVYNTGTDNEDV